MKNGLVALLFFNSVENFFRPELALFYKKDTGELIECFSDIKGLFKNNVEVKTANITEILADFRKALTDEFNSVMEMLDYDSLLETDSVVITKAEEAYKKGTKIDYVIPEVENISFSFLSEIYNDINDTAYRYLEKYMENNPAYLRECQRIFTANKLFAEKLKENGFIVDDESLETAKEKINKILTKAPYKSVRIFIETNEGMEFSKSVKIPFDLRSLPPYYAIKTIEWRKTVLYSRNETLAKDWKKNLEENLEFINKRFYNFHCKFKIDVTKVISRQLLKDKRFCLELLKKHNAYLDIIDEDLRKDVSFVKEFLETVYAFPSKETLDKILDIFSDFKAEEWFYVSLVSSKKCKTAYHLLSLTWKQNKAVLASYLSGNNSTKLIEQDLTNEILTDELLEYVEDLKSSDPEFYYNVDVLPRCKSKQIAINLIATNDLGFDKINKAITVDKDFVLKVLDKSNSWNIYYANDNNKLSSLYFNPTLKYLLDDEDIKMAFMSRVRTTNKCQILAQYLSFTTEKAKSIIKKDEKLASVLLAMLTDEQKKELIDENPNLLISLFDSFINIEYRKKTIKLQLILDVFDKDMELVRGVLKCYYFSTEDFAWLIKNKIELLKVVPSDRVTWNLLKTVKDEYYILPYLKQSIDSVHILTDEEFMKEQAELSPDKLILKYCLPPRGTIKHRLDFLTEKKDFVLDIIKLNPKNIYDLPKKSHLWLDVDFAKEVIELIPDAKKLFSKTIIAKL